MNDDSNLRARFEKWADKEWPEISGLSSGVVTRAFKREREIAWQAVQACANSDDARDAARYRKLLTECTLIESADWIWESDDEEMIHPNERLDAAIARSNDNG